MSVAGCVHLSGKSGHGVPLDGFKSEMAFGARLGWETSHCGWQWMWYSVPSKKYHLEHKAAKQLLFGPYREG